MKVNILKRLLILLAFAALSVSYLSADNNKQSISADNPLQEYENGDKRNDNAQGSKDNGSNPTPGDRDRNPDSQPQTSDSQPGGGDSDFDIPTSNVPAAEEINPTDQDKSPVQNVTANSNSSLITIIVALAVALLVIGVLIYYRNTVKNGKRHHHSNRDREAPYCEEYDYTSSLSGNNAQMQHSVDIMMQDIADLKSQIKRLSNTVADLNGKISSIPQKSTSNSHGLGQDSRTQRNGVPASKKLYAEDVEAAGFNVSDLSQNMTSDVIAVLEVNGNNGTYQINQDETAQPMLLSQFVYGAGRITDVVDRSNSPTAIQTVTPGTIELVNGMWKIKEKAKVRLI